MRWILIVPLLVLLVLFALSNRETVQLGLWPFDLRVGAPVGVAMLLLAGIAFLLGAFVTWAGSLGARRRARRIENAAKALEAELGTMRAREAAAAAAAAQRGASDAPPSPPLVAVAGGASRR